MRAAAVEPAECAGLVAEQHQVLAQQAHGLQRAFTHARVQARIELVEQGGRLPIAAQQIAPGRAGPMRVMSSFWAACILPGSLGAAAG